MGYKIFAILTILMMTGCSLFVAQPPADEGQVCVDEQSLTELLDSLNMTVDDLEPGMELPEENLAEVLTEDGRFSTLLTAVVAAELEPAFEGGGPLTVFAPTDEAFAQIPNETLNALLADQETLRDILLFHVVDGMVDSGDVVGLDSALTLQGSSLDIEVSDSTVMLDGAEVIEVDMYASNGVIHVIDSVMLPPEDEDMGEDEPEEGEEEEPAEDGIPTRTFQEGELVELSPTGTDPDGDPITFTFSEPLDENGQWQTQEGDAGEYLVTVTASDGKTTVSRQVRIVVLGANSPPEITGLSDLTVQEGDTVTLSPAVSDADGDDVEVTYSGWMTSATRTTNFNDAGVHSVTVTATDGTNTVTEAVTITVQNRNRAPVLADLVSITVDEGETVQVEPDASDPDNDAVQITFSSPLDETGTWETEIGDAGTYLVTVTVSDGSLETRKSLTIVVESENSPPEIELDDETVVIQQGDTGTVTLSPVVSDSDGDDVEVTYSGWMTSSTRDISQEDEGEHQVTVTADDGQLQSSVTVTVTVEVNEPPSFDFG